MEQKPIKRRTIWISGLALAAIFTTVALASQNKNSFGIPGQPLFRTLSDNRQDTLPKKSKSKPKEQSSTDSRNLDKAFEDVKNALQRLDKELKKVDPELYEEYMDKVRQELDETFENEHWQSYNYDMKKAMKEMEMLQRKGEWDQLNKQEDLFKMNDEMNDAFKELNNAKLFQEKDMLMNKLDMEKMNKAMEDAKWELERNQENFKFDFEELQDKLQKSKIDMEHAHVELKNLKALMKAFEKDGLIKKGKPYNIKIEKGNLYVDGKKQPENITNKYKNDERFKKFFEEDNNFTMNSDGNDDDNDDDWL